MEEIKKKCTKCGEEKAPELFAKNKNAKDGRDYHCKNCKREYGKGDTEKTKQRSKRWRQKSKEIIKQIRVKYRHNNLVTRRVADNNAQQRVRDKLKDGYIVTRLRAETGLSTKEIRANPDMIEAKRQLLKLKRAIQNYDKEQQGRS